MTNYRGKRRENSNQIHKTPRSIDLTGTLGGRDRHLPDVGVRP
jgi:hypothetical protein